MTDKKTTTVGGFKIGGNSTYVIAEIGSNHCQDIALAKEHIVAAAESGANAVKFQSLNVNEQYFNPSQSIVELHKLIDFNETWYEELNNFSKKHNVTFFSSPTYFRSIELLERINVPVYKLASAQIATFPQLVRKVAETGKPVIFSTGLVSYADIEKSVKIFKDSGNDNLIILHCNSVYPTPPDIVGLQVMETYRKMFGCIVGFSDHTEGITVASAAVALGAKVIEKHFVTDKKSSSPDASSSILPSQFKQMVDNIRVVEQACDSKIRIEIAPEEAKFKARITNKIILNKAKKKGDLILESDFDFKRTEGGINSFDNQLVLGKPYITDLPKNTVLEYFHINFQPL